MILEHLLFFIAAIVVLVISGSVMVKSLSKIASFLHVSEYAIGFILLAFATSLPELFVGISSAINKNSSLIVGTIIGSNIANLTIIIGIPVLLAKGITIRSKKTTIDSFLMIGLAALTLILMVACRGISRLDGVILLCAFFAYIFKLVREGKQFTKEFENRISHKMIITYVCLFIMSLGLLYLSSDYVVKYASLLALDFSIPAIFIGLFMVAIGTSLPELVSGISAVSKGHTDMGVGNIIGSVVANSTFVLGISALIFPITADFLLFVISACFMILVSIIFAAFVYEKNKLTWIEGIALILLYIFFMIVEFYMKGAA